MKFIPYLLLFLIFVSLKPVKNIKLTEFTSSECLNENIWERNYLNRIVNHSIKGNLQVYDIFIIENCSLASKGEIEVRNDTLNLIYKGETSVIIDTISYKKHNDGSETLSYTIEEEITISECDCAFNLKYKIEGLNRKKEYIVLANNIRIEKTKHKYPIIKKSPTFDIIDNDTVNYVDIYGHKQGLHIWKHNNKLYSKIKFKDNEEFSGLLSTRYNFNGFEKIEMYMDKGKYTETKYYKNGKLFKICDTQESFFEEGTNCKYLK